MTDPAIAKVLDEERISMGRDVTLLDSAVLEGVVVIAYRCAPLRFDNDERAMVETRLVCRGERVASSMIVKTEWVRPGG